MVQILSKHLNLTTKTRHGSKYLGRFPFNNLTRPSQINELRILVVHDILIVRLVAVVTGGERLIYGRGLGRIIVVRNVRGPQQLGSVLHQQRGWRMTIVVVDRIWMQRHIVAISDSKKNIIITITNSNRDCITT